MANGKKEVGNINLLSMSNEELKLNDVMNKCFARIFEFSKIVDYLHSRGITDELIIRFKLGYGNFYGKNWITIPITDVNGDCLFLKLRRDPYVSEQSEPSKYKFYPQGSESSIYGWEILLNTDSITVVEGEFDRILLESKGIHAITSTGGAMTFKKEWLIVFKNIKKISILFDKDSAGSKGALRLAYMIAEKYNNEKEVSIVTLPDDVGESGDVTDYIVLLQRDVVKLFKTNSQKFTYEPLPQKEKINYNYNFNNSSLTKEQIDAASSVDCSKFIEIVKSVNGLSWARCPFGTHEDKTPSMCCYPGDKGYYAFCCGESGNAIVLVEKLHGLKFVEAVKFVLENSK